MKNYEEILRTITHEQWKAIAAFASEKVEATEAVSIPEEQEPKDKELTEKKLYTQVTELLQKIGAKPNIKGYRYIREAVVMVYGRWDYIEAMTKELYPEIAKRFSTTASRVERAMRHSVEVFFDYGNEEVLREIFTCDPNRGKATNSEAIACMVEYLKNR